MSGNTSRDLRSNSRHGAVLVLLCTVILLASASALCAQDGQEAAQPPDTFLSIVFSGGWSGVVIMLAIIALSVTALYFIIEHLWTIRRAEVLPDGLGDQVRQLLLAGRLVDADQLCQSKPSVLSLVLRNGLTEADGGWSAVEKATEDALAEQLARLMRKIEYLQVIANLAPMLGLLGTVTGMVICFRRVAVTQGSAGAADLAAGIYQALVTTVAGLIVAIPALGAFALFRNRVDQFIAEAAYIAQHALAPLKRRRSGTRAAAGPPPPPVSEGR